MKIYDAEESFVDALFRRPQMYLVGNKFEGIINLMFGIRAAAEHHAPDDLAVQRWRAFELWMFQRQGNQTGFTGVWTVFRQQHSDDEAAVEALWGVYAEYVGSLGQ